MLAYRELGFPLEEIATLLDDRDVDGRRQHHQRAWGWAGAGAVAVA